MPESGTREPPRPSRITGYHNAIIDVDTEDFGPPPTYERACAPQRSLKRTRSLPTQGGGEPPQYACSLTEAGLANVKYERTSPFDFLDTRQWSDVFVVLQGTRLSLHEPRTPGLFSKGNKGIVAGKLLKSYTLQHAEVGVGADCKRFELVSRSPMTALLPLSMQEKLKETEPHLFEHVRQYIFRLRVECDQILLRVRSWEERATWVEKLCAAIDISPPIEDRTEPRNHTLPRRRQARRRNDQNSHTRMQNLVEGQQRIMAERYPHLLQPEEQSHPSEQDAVDTADPDAEDLDLGIVRGEREEEGEREDEQGDHQPRNSHQRPSSHHHSNRPESPTTHSHCDVELSSFVNRLNTMLRTHPHASPRELQRLAPPLPPALQEHPEMRLHFRHSRPDSLSANSITPATATMSPSANILDPFSFAGNAARPSFANGPFQPSANNSLPPTSSGATDEKYRYTTPTPQMDAAQEMRYRRRCMPSLLANSRRATDVIIKDGVRYTVDTASRSLKPYPSPPPEYGELAPSLSLPGHDAPDGGEADEGEISQIPTVAEDGQGRPPEMLHLRPTQTSTAQGRPSRPALRTMRSTATVNESTNSSSSSAEGESPTGLRKLLNVRSLGRRMRKPRGEDAGSDSRRSAADNERRLFEEKMRVSHAKVHARPGTAVRKLSAMSGTM